VTITCCTAVCALLPNSHQPDRPLTHHMSRGPRSALSATTSRPFARRRTRTAPALAPSAEPEPVPIRITSPTSNSRTIIGSIFVPDVTVDDVWAILTDYDRLSVHVPNLVESARRGDDGGTPAGSGKNGSGCAGDGSYQCRLYQRGAQKIIGFTFGASVTMNMEEKSLAGHSPPAVSGRERSPAALQRAAGTYLRDLEISSGTRCERTIDFKCVDSRFFGAFDGVWRAASSPDFPGGVCLEYEVYVKPKGPVPVAALEWRIKEDVPINLRAVKLAAMEVGLEGVMNHRTGGKWSSIIRSIEDGKVVSANVATLPESSNNVATARNNLRVFPNRNKEAAKRSIEFPEEDKSSSSKFFAGYKPVFIDWEDDETMAKYLPRGKNSL